MTMLTKQEPPEKTRMVQLLDALATAEGFTDSVLNDVKFLRATRHIPRRPRTHEPCIVIVGQGRKCGYLGDEVYTYDSCNYFVLTLPLPFECETIGSPEEPLLAVSISINLTLLSELLAQMGDYRVPNKPVPRGIYATPLTSELANATLRLLECLSRPAHSRILGPQIVREIIYWVLCGKMGDALRALAIRHSYFGQIAKVLKKIHNEYHKKIDMGFLAREANMSKSSFHDNFKSVTATTPLQYLKTIRLHKARMLMVQDGVTASSAATSVGYESVSQFSREFRRFFGSSPIVEAKRMRTTGD